MKFVRTRFCHFMKIGCICMAMAALSGAQETGEGLHMVTQKPHPLEEIFFKLATSYHWPLTYEEAPVFAADDLTTLTSPTGRVGLVKRGTPLFIDLSPDDLSATGTARLDVIRSVLNAYSKSRSAESFSTNEDQGFIHVVPVAVRGVNGQKQNFEPMLNTKISFPGQHFPTVYDFLNEVLNQVSQRRAVPIVLGTTPTNMFRQTMVFAGANDEPARDVLSRAFRDINSSQRDGQRLDAIRLVWGMLYEPTGHQYWFNVSVANIRPANDEPSQQLPLAPKTNSNAYPNRQPNGVRKSN